MSRQAIELGPRDPRLEAWRTFLYAHAHVRRLLERELQAEQGMGMGEYEVLLLLAYSPERRQRMSDLADSLVLSRSGATRLIDRLEAQGLVERVSCDTDRRGQWAQLTRGRLRAAANRFADAPARHRGALRRTHPARGARGTERHPPPRHARGGVAGYVPPACSDACSRRVAPSRHARRAGQAPGTGRTGVTASAGSSSARSASSPRKKGMSGSFASANVGVGIDR